MSTASITRTWEILPARGYSTAWVDFAPDSLSARGRAVGLLPEPYWVSYELETTGGYVTTRLGVTVETATSTESLELRHDGEGRWTVNGAERPDLGGALDCDLGLCPLTNTMPVLRHALHRKPGPGPEVFTMAWVSVPELTVSLNRQTYTHLARAEHGARIRYQSGDFQSDIEVDDRGMVLDYPSLATALTH
ncbi:putative glycolipid-binding domain-containing protein [Streptomyces sp. NBC_00162]|uniref:putative glycolipid-binding domain-containing protein n=1 Tax=Streptomyces sp. NBC_00162 TaxID=2903629 RepID=UPI00214BAE17|nr:putative glycolipid-binding domain-containing protein [Streptomyces sp. NBC_00162]UUU38172.1 putative glycolipid-binding domain-containing protein [Streptomyces sp. NBC_00162]